MRQLLPHQEVALRKLSNGKILWGGVGSGKTYVAAEYYKLKEAPRDVYIITTAKKRDDFDWQNQFYELGIGPRSGPTNARSVLLDGDRRGGHNNSLGEAGVYPYVLTVDSWNNIDRYVDVEGAFFVLDEQRLVGTGAWVKSFYKIAKKNHWILLSATPGDTWLDYAPVFIANNFYKNITDFKREHVVYSNFTKFPKVDRYINVGRLARYRHQLLVEMPFVRHTRRRQVEVPLRYDKDLLEQVLKKRWHVYEDRPLRDVGEMFLVARKVVNSDPSRLEMVKELWKQHPKLIVFYNFNFELESLRSLREYYGIPNLATGTRTKTAEVGSGVTTSMPISTAGSKVTRTSSDLHSPGESAKNSKVSLETFASTDGTLMSTVAPPDSILIGEWNGHKHQPVPTGSSANKDASSLSIAEWNGHKHQPVPTTDRWLYLVQYTAGAEGWNCITTDAMVMYSRNYSWKVTEQAEGRIDRLNTPFTDLWYYDFMTDSFIDKAIGKSLRAKKTFNESRYKGLFEG